MEVATIISVGSLVIALLTFVATQLGGKKAAKLSYVGQLEKKIEELEEEIKALKGRIEEIELENLRLMRKLLTNAKEGGET